MIHPDSPVVLVRSDTPINPRVSEDGEWLCIELPARPWPVLVCLTSQGADELAAMLTMHVRGLRRQMAGEPVRSPVPGLDSSEADQ